MNIIGEGIHSFNMYLLSVLLSDSLRRKDKDSLLWYYLECLFCAIYLYYLLKYCFLHFPDEETEELRDLVQFTQLVIEDELELGCYMILKPIP